ncbi:flagellar biosynthetic protein FliO [Pseudomonas sp. NPDC089734]|uniref:flagellar biosynthetic protein FliO n=1 Tax=Pseudomonas sp. NPDC089734 TaxID=3364469 RepID=UPI0037FEC72C
MSDVSQTPPVALGAASDSLMSLALLGKTALALGLVVACVFVCGWLLRRIGTRPLVPGQIMRVVSSTSVGQREKVVIVEVQGKWLVLGVTAQQVSALSQMDAPPAPAEGSAPLAGNTFAERLASALKRNIQRTPDKPENPS